MSYRLGGSLFMAPDCLNPPRRVTPRSVAMFVYGNWQIQELPLPWPTKFVSRLLL